MPDCAGATPCMHRVCAYAPSLHRERTENVPRTHLAKILRPALPCRILVSFLLRINRTLRSPYSRSSYTTTRSPISAHSLFRSHFISPQPNERPFGVSLFRYRNYCEQRFVRVHSRTAFDVWAVRRLGGPFKSDSICSNYPVIIAPRVSMVPSVIRSKKVPIPRNLS